MKDFLPKNDPFFYLHRLGKAIVKSSILLFILSVVFAILPPVINKTAKKLTYHTDIFKTTSYETSLFLTISSSLLASSILTGTLSVVETRQRRDDLNAILKEMGEYTQNTVQKIYNSSTDSIFKELVGDEAIFKEINQYIIRRDYIRTLFDVDLEFQEIKDNQEYLLKTMTMKYVIKNISVKPVEYTIVAIVEKENEEIFKNSTKITNMSISFFSGQMPPNESEVINNYYDQTRLYKLIESRAKSIKFKEDIIIPPNESLYCVWTSETIVSSIWHDPIISLGSSTYMTVEISQHPENLEITAEPLHPNFQSFERQKDKPHMKRWKINAGILPGQGIQLSWKPKNQAIAPTTNLNP